MVETVPYRFREVPRRIGVGYHLSDGLPLPVPTEYLDGHRVDSDVSTEIESVATTAAEQQLTVTTDMDATTHGRFRSVVALVSQALVQ